MRLVDGETSNEGRVEYCYYGEWSILCSIDNNVYHGGYIYGRTASTICNQLGHNLNNCKLVAIHVAFYHIHADASVFIDGRFNKTYTNKEIRLHYIHCSATIKATLGDCEIVVRPCLSYTCSDPYTYYSIRCYGKTSH